MGVKGSVTKAEYLRNLTMHYSDAENFTLQKNRTGLHVQYALRPIDCKRLSVLYPVVLLAVRGAMLGRRRHPEHFDSLSQSCSYASRL